MTSVVSFLRKMIPFRPKVDASEARSVSISEETLIKNMLALEQISVDDIMTPRGDIFWLEGDTPLPGVLEKLSGRQNQEVIVCEGKLDHVAGVVSLGDLLTAVQSPSTFALKALVRPALFVSPSVPCAHAFLQMVQHKTSVALVLDEHGAIDGAVTVAHLMEVMVDSIQRVGDPFESRLLECKENNTWVVDGRLPLEEIEDLFKVSLEEGDAATVGGFVLQMAEHVPLRGALFQHPSGLNFHVLESDPRKVKRVEISQRPDIVAS